MTAGTSSSGRRQHKSMYNDKGTLSHDTSMSSEELGPAQWDAVPNGLDGIDAARMTFRDHSWFCSILIQGYNICRTIETLNTYSPLHKG